ncbi:MAG: methyl-accepting chemotaxis protein, partial [Deltaproteobacteria bacterium]|nr:methyl-accepting chemotaxis protein [Deltaproteobacteria bacterium]
MKRGVRFKLVCGGILIIVIPLLVVGIFSFVKSARELEDISKGQSIQLAKSIASMVHLVLQEEVKVIHTLSNNQTAIEAATKVKQD